VIAVTPGAAAGDEAFGDRVADHLGAKSPAAARPPLKGAEFEQAKENRIVRGQWHRGSLTRRATSRRSLSLLSRKGVKAHARMRSDNAR